MQLSRRNLFMVGGLFGVTSKVISEEASGAQTRQPGDYHWGDPYEYMAQARAADHQEALPPEATQGPWRNLRAVRQKRVIDIGSHSGETRTQSPTYREHRTDTQRIEMVDFTESLIESMDKHGIAKACLTVLAVGGRMQFPQIVRSRERYPGRFEIWGGLRNLRPRPAGVEAARILREQLSGHGAKGVGENGYPQSDNSQDLRPFMELVMESDVPVLADGGGWGANVGGSPSYQAGWHSLERFGNLVAGWPDVTWIMCDTGGPFDHLDAWEALRVAFSYENVYVETSKTSARVITEAVRGIGAERVIYGSDWNRPEMKSYGPFHYRGAYQHWWSLNQVALADITEDERDMILYKNALRLLKESN